MHRLKTRSQFQAVLAGGTIARTAHFALHGCVLEQVQVPVCDAAAVSLCPVSGVWMGAMVPKRWAKRAVTRNAIKRQIYLVGAGFEPTLARSAYVVRLRATFDRKQFLSAASDLLKAAVRAELLQLFVRAQNQQAAGNVPLSVSVVVT
ncbi:MAG: ribonuclease P protein component [Burkholderiales bacterium]|nr:ribonuclease P protein component [Burkholderiales bacterium]